MRAWRSSLETGILAPGDCLAAAEVEFWAGAVADIEHSPMNSIIIAARYAGMSTLLNLVRSLPVRQDL